MVLAIDGWTETAEVAAMVDRCAGPVHVEGDLDRRIVGFYERLRADFPDHPPYGDACPWASMPLDVGIDHVFLSLRFGPDAGPAIDLISALAAEYALTVWDPQDRSASRPVTPPSREEVAAWWQDLIDGRCGRAETHERVRPWIEETPEAVDDPITSMGLQQLYGFGSWPGDAAVADRFGQWRRHGERFDDDPDGWVRDRLVRSVLAVRRDQGLGQAQALALQLAAQGSLTPEDITRILGPSC